MERTCLSRPLCVLKVALHSLHRIAAVFVAVGAGSVDVATAVAGAGASSDVAGTTVNVGERGVRGVESAALA